MPRLVAIGLVAGFFSALFGVGGGIVTVPLLVLAARFTERPAAATSLAAIGVTALAGTVGYGVQGYLDIASAALIGLPAAAGALAGTSLQQRITNKALSLAFAGVLVVIAVVLLVR